MRVSTSTSGLSLPLASKSTRVPLACLLYAVSAIALSLAMHCGNGQYSESGLLWIVLSGLTCVAALAGFRGSVPSRLLTGVLLAGLGLALAGVPRVNAPRVPSRVTPDEAGWMACGLVVIGISLAVLGLVARSRRLAFGLFGAVLVVAGICGGWMVHKTPNPHIDVTMFQEKASAMLLTGGNPYSMRFTDPYTPAESARYYGPGVSVGGILQFGYPYLPVSLFAVVPGFLLGDVRYALLATMLLGALGIAFTWRSRTALLAALLLLLNPQASRMLRLGWIEPISVALLAGVCYCLYRKKQWLPYALGLLLVSKQYMVIVAPLALLLLDRPWRWRQVWDLAWKATLTGCLVTLPLALWDIRAFWESVVALQFKQPYRPDSLSFLVWMKPANPDAWRWVPFAAAALALGAILTAGRRQAVSFPGAMALVLLLFFCLNKQAFGNYYYLVLGSLCCAIAESHAVPTTTASDPSSSL